MRFTNVSWSTAIRLRLCRFWTSLNGVASWETIECAGGFFRDRRRYTTGLGDLVGDEGEVLTFFYDAGFDIAVVDGFLENSFFPPR